MTLRGAGNAQMHIRYVLFHALLEPLPHRSFIETDCLHTYVLKGRFQNTQQPGLLASEDNKRSKVDQTPSVSAVRG